MLSTGSEETAFRTEPSAPNRGVMGRQWPGNTNYAARHRKKENLLLRKEICWGSA